MKWLILIAIQFYWKFFPSSLKRTCLFKETCSHFVYNQTKEYGWLIGINALKKRLRNCRNSYNLYSGKKGFEIELNDKTIIYENEISPIIIKSIYEKIKNYEYTCEKINSNAKGHENNLPQMRQ